MLPDKKFAEIQPDGVKLYNGARDKTPVLVPKETYIAEITLEQYKTRLAQTDWYYYQSDDHNVYLGGRAWTNLMHDIAEQRDDDFKQAYNLAHQSAFDKSHFAGTYVFPYPDVAYKIHLENLSEANNV